MINSGFHGEEEFFFSPIYGNIDSFGLQVLHRIGDCVVVVSIRKKVYITNALGEIWTENQNETNEPVRRVHLGTEDHTLATQINATCLSTIEGEGGCGVPK